MIDTKILKPETRFIYKKLKELPAGWSTVDVLEGPFTQAKAEGKVSPVTKLKLSEEVFGTEIRPDVMARVVRWQRNNAMQGTHKAKTKAEVSGTGKKPYKQKGTGLARQGSLRNPHYRGGGAAFPPTPRDHEHKLNKKERRLGLRSALAARLQEERLFVVDSLEPKKTPLNEKKAPVEGEEVFVKTSELANHFHRRMKLDSLVLVDAEQNPTLVRAARNLHNLHYLPQVGLNVYAILRMKHVVITVDALRMLEDRLSETKQRERRYMKRGWTEQDRDSKEARDKASSSQVAKDQDKTQVIGRIERRRQLFRMHQARMTAV